MPGVRRDPAHDRGQGRVGGVLQLDNRRTTSDGIDQILVLLAIGHPDVAAFAVNDLAVGINDSGASVNGLDRSHPFRAVDHVVRVAGGAGNLPAHE